MPLPSDMTQLYENEGLGPLIQPGRLPVVPDRWAASLSFMSADDLIYAAIPPGVATGYVTSRWDDDSGGTSLTLRIALASSSSFANVSASPSAPTNLSPYAGQAVKFQAFGMPAEAKQAVFGLRMD